MIGNLMSEAAHSIIGMFSARSAGMESKASNSDFGSLLLSSEKQPQFGGAEVEIDISEIEVETPIPRVSTSEIKMQFLSNSGKRPVFCHLSIKALVARYFIRSARSPTTDKMKPLAIPSFPILRKRNCRSHLTEMHCRISDQLPLLLMARPARLKRD